MTDNFGNFSTSSAGLPAVTASATGAASNGVHGLASSNDASAIYGEHTAGGIGVFGRGGPTGGEGVFGQTASDSSGVYGKNTGGGDGVKGESANGTGVRGESTNGIGVYGQSNTDYGVQGYSTSTTMAAVYGFNPDGIGVFGSGNTIAVQGSTSSGVAVQGQVIGEQAAIVGISGTPQLSGHGPGVFGSSINGPGVNGYSKNSFGIYGYSDTNWSGYFGGIDPGVKGVYITVPAGQPGLQVASGTKNAVVATSQGMRTLYTEEATAVWFTDYGFGHLQDGHSVVSIDPLFAETVNLSEPYHVFIQLNDAEAEGVAVINKLASSFEVVELRNGRSNAEFSYRLAAKRRGYETSRLEHAPWGDDDPNLYPEKRSAWEAQHRLRHPEVGITLPTSR